MTPSAGEPPRCNARRQLDAYDARHQPIQVAAVYEVVDGLIRRAWFCAAD